MFWSVLSHLVVCWHQRFHPYQNGLATTTCLLSQISSKFGLEGVLILFSKFTVKLCPLTLLHWQEAHSWRGTIGNSAVTFSQEGKILNALSLLPHQFQLYSKWFEWDFGFLEVSTWLLPWEWLTFTFPIEGAAMAMFPEEMQPVVFEGTLPRLDVEPQGPQVSSWYIHWRIWKQIHWLIAFNSISFLSNAAGRLFESWVTTGFCSKEERMCGERGTVFFSFQYNNINVSGLEAELLVFANVLVFSLFF